MTSNMSTPFQYTIGIQLDLVEHTPPLPFGCPEYANSNADMINKLGRQPSAREKQLEYVSQVSPIATAVPENPRKATLVVLEDLCSTKLYGARVFRCSVKASIGGTPLEAVAKIYDPLYYRFDEDPGAPNHVLMQADVDYSREAAAYERLNNTKVDGVEHFTPTYYGSWTFNRPVTNSSDYQMRSLPVRLVLIEYFPQDTLYAQFYVQKPDIIHSKNALGYPEDFRLGVLADVLDMAVKQMQAGVDQGDFSTRNVILSLGGSEEQKLITRPRRYVILDYNNSLVYSKSTWMHIFDREGEKPMNPLQVFWGSALTGFNGWQPAEWVGHPELRQKWLYDTFGPNGRVFDRYETLDNISQQDIKTLLADLTSK